MKTIRLLYPDHVGGGLEQYFFGAQLMAHILPENERQPLIRVDVEAPDGTERSVTDGIYGKREVVSGIRSAAELIERERPDRIVTIGGTCLVSLAPFDYLHGKYGNLGIVWIDAHPDVSTVDDGYPNAHAMVLGSLMGHGDVALSSLMKHEAFGSDDILYVGLQDIHEYQRAFLDKAGVRYRVQSDSFVSEGEILAFTERFDHILVHLDVDVLSEKLFHSTYFANPDLVGDGSGGGRMTLEELGAVLRCITGGSDVVGFTIAEYLPFDEYKLHKLFSGIRLFTE